MLPGPDGPEGPDAPGVGVLRYSGLMSCDGENGVFTEFEPNVPDVAVLEVKGVREGKEERTRSGDVARDGAGMTLALRARRRMRRRERAYRPAGTRCSARC